MTDTVANGNRVFTVRDETNSQPARQFAAAIDRDHPAVGRIKPAVRYDVVVWLQDECEEPFTAPDGWEIDSVYVASRNGTALRLNKTDE